MGLAGLNLLQDSLEVRLKRVTVAIKIDSWEECARHALETV